MFSLPCSRTSTSSATRWPWNTWILADGISALQDRPVIPQSQELPRRLWRWDQDSRCAYFALQHLALFKSQRMYKTACTAHVLAMLLPGGKHTQLQSSEAVPLGARLLEQHRQLAPWRAQLYSYEGICTFGVLFCDPWTFVIVTAECTFFCSVENATWHYDNILFLVNICILICCII